MKKLIETNFKKYVPNEDYLDIFTFEYLSDAWAKDDYTEDIASEMISIFAFVALIMFGIIFLAIYIERQSRKCPNCKQIALKKISADLIGSNFGVKTYRDTYACSKCGTRVERNRDELDSNNNRRGGGPIIMGGGFGRGFGGGSFGGGWGGGRFGGGGAGSRW